MSKNIRTETSRALDFSILLSIASALFADVSIITVLFSFESIQATRSSPLYWALLIPLALWAMVSWDIQNGLYR